MRICFFYLLIFIYFNQPNVGNRIYFFWLALMTFLQFVFLVNKFFKFLVKFLAFFNFCKNWLFQFLKQRFLFLTVSSSSSSKSIYYKLVIPRFSFEISVIPLYSYHVNLTNISIDKESSWDSEKSRGFSSFKIRFFQSAISIIVNRSSSYKNRKNSDYITYSPKHAERNATNQPHYKLYWSSALSQYYCLY